jgi:hypothetical protein
VENGICDGIADETCPSNDFKTACFGKVIVYTFFGVWGGEWEEVLRESMGNFYTNHIPCITFDSTRLIQGRSYCTHLPYHGTLSCGICGDYATL